MDMEASTSYQLRSSSKPVQESHLDLLRHGTLSDVTFLVGPTKEKIQCHQAFLVARSSVFEVMFSERWNQVSNKEIPLEDIDPKIFKKFLQFIYSDEFVANLAAALELLQVAHTYDVQLLVSKCEELLLATEVPLNDILDVFLAARKYEMVQLMNKAGDSIANSLSELQSHPSFSRVDKETLVYLLERNCLNVKEVDLFKSALRWAKSQPEFTLEESLKDILPLIRFPVMTLEEFTTTVVPTGLLSQSTLLEVSTYFGTDAETKKSMADTLEFNTRRRQTTDSIQYVNLYLGDLASKKPKVLQLKKLKNCLQIRSRITGTKAMGIHSISMCCPATVVSTVTRPVRRTFKEFKIVFKSMIPQSARDARRKILLTMSPVKVEEGKMTEIKFDTVIPLDNNARYFITVEEICSAGTQMAAEMEDYYIVKVFCRIRNWCLVLDRMNNSVVIDSMCKNDAHESYDKSYEHPQMIYRFGLEEL